MNVILINSLDHCHVDNEALYGLILIFSLDHWDVDNEALHGRYFEKHTGDPDIINKMFNWTNASEPHSKLFLNDFNILNSNLFTTVSYYLRVPTDSLYFQYKLRLTTT
jgi:hypothetical protein